MDRHCCVLGSGVCLVVSKIKQAAIAACFIELKKGLLKDLQEGHSLDSY
jgi:hypothetical protein